MNAKLSWLALATGAVLSLSLPGSALQAQQTPKPEKTAEAAAAKGRGAATAPDENIKTMRGTNTPGANIPLPAAKGGPATRGAACVVHIDNRTSLYIGIYLDGDYRGTVGPGGDTWHYVGCGETRLYARADFDDGTYSYWGPRVEDVDGTFHWHLTR
jgi:hypothetical protein